MFKDDQQYGDPIAGELAANTTFATHLGYFPPGWYSADVLLFDSNDIAYQNPLCTGFTPLLEYTCPCTDTDGDTVCDTDDGCPNDSNKTEAGACGCGVADTDTDGDGVADCIDNCPNTSNPDQLDTNGDGTGDACENCPDSDGDGVCDPDDVCQGFDDLADADGDTIPDGCDNCPNDALKTEPGACGCGIPDTDSDNDGTPDCDDLCPNNPQKTDPGTCGCENREDTSDRDGDGVPGCLDQEKNSPCNGPGEVDANGISLDSDGDGVLDCEDVCDGPDLDQDGDKIPDCIDPNPYCRGDRIVICHVANNGSTKTLCISESQWARHEDHGDTIRDEPCPGAQLNAIEYEEDLTMEMNVYTNPTSQEVNVELKNLQKQYNLRVYNLSGVQLYESTIAPGDSQTIRINERFAPGTYIIQVANGYERVSKKFIIEN